MKKNVQKLIEQALDDTFQKNIKRKGIHCIANNQFKHKMFFCWGLSRYEIKRIGVLDYSTLVRGDKAFFKIGHRNVLKCTRSYLTLVSNLRYRGLTVIGA